MMVGEIRDVETAKIAVQASLTGHLVFSTLHTNDAAGAVIRLIDMGIPPYLIANSVIGVLAQRLVRTICDACRTEYEPDTEMLKQFSAVEAFQGFTFTRGKGCSECMNTGFRRQTGLFELLIITKQIRELINESSDSAEIVEVGREEGLKLLREDGMDKVLRSITTLEEIVRVTQDSEEEALTVIAERVEITEVP